MIKVLILIVLTALYIFRFSYRYQQGLSSRFLLISYFLTYSAFQYSAVILRGAPDHIGGGALGPNVRITMTIIIIGILIFLVKPKLKLLKKDRWVWVVTLFVIFSFINPFNNDWISTLTFCVFFFSHILLFFLINSYCTSKDILMGTYDGLALLCLIQFPLAIAFPLLNIEAVTIPFQSAAEVLATRYGQRDGAVGIFEHPGVLGFFSLISSTFFYSSFLTGYKKKRSLVLLIITGCTIILTYSRTSYIAFIICLLALYYIYQRANKFLISFALIYKFIIPMILLFVWLIYYSPLSETFLESNVDQMLDGRLIYVAMANDIFQNAPLTGVGINGHRDFILEYPNILTSAPQHEFFYRNPIHNIHLIILTELGIIGLVMWIGFIIKSILRGKKAISLNINNTFLLGYIGVLIATITYGMAGWAPFSATMLSMLLFFIYFQNHLEIYNSSE